MISWRELSQLSLLQEPPATFVLFHDIYFEKVVEVKQTMGNVYTSHINQA